MSFRIEDTWEHSVHAKRFLAMFVSTSADIARGQLVCMYMDASILVVDILVLKVKKVSLQLPICCNKKKEANDCHKVLPLCIYSRVWPGSSENGKGEADVKL